MSPRRQLLFVLAMVLLTILVDAVDSPAKKGKKMRHSERNPALIF